jgi:hypothetical protein
MMNSSDNESSIDLNTNNKDLTSKYTDRFSSILKGLTIKNDNPMWNNTLNSTNKNLYSTIKEPKIITVDKMNERGKLVKQQLSLDSVYSRLGRLREAQRLNELDRKNYELAKQYSRNSPNKRKNEEILGQIDKLFQIFDNMKTASSKSGMFKYPDSLLNSHKDFIIIKKNKEFNEGVPILKLKQDDYIQKAKNIMTNKNMGRENNTQVFKSGNNQAKNTFIDSIPLENKMNIDNMLINMKIINNKKKGRFFPTELEEIKEHDNHMDNSKIQETEKNLMDINQHKKPKKSHISRSESFASPFPSKLNNTSNLLPKLKIKDLSVESLPVHEDIYSKINIKDIFKLVNTAKPPFKF